MKMSPLAKDGGAPGTGAISRNGYAEPSENVKALSEASNKRQDDLREASNKLTDAKLAHLKEIGDLREECQKSIGELREEYQEKIGRAESGRLDSIRQVDREEVAKTAVSANTAITTLAKQTTDLATTLQKQVSDTATAAEARNSATYSDVNKRLSALELTLSEGKGKQSYADPELAKFMDEVKNLSDMNRLGMGRTAGANSSWGIILGAGSFVTVILAILGFFISNGNKVPTAPLQPQVIYVPSPAVAPASPPQAIPGR